MPKESKRPKSRKRERVVADEHKEFFKKRKPSRKGIPIDRLPAKKKIDKTYATETAIRFRERRGTLPENYNENKTLNWVPNKIQIQLAMAIANPDVHGGSNRQKALAIGITSASYYVWMHDQRFINFIHTLIPIYTDAAIPEAWCALVRLVRQGDLAAIQTFFKMKGLEPQKTSMAMEINIEQALIELDQKNIQVNIQQGANTGKLPEPSSVESEPPQTARPDPPSPDDYPTQESSEILSSLSEEDFAELVEELPFDEAD